MRTENVEILSDRTNTAVMRHPGRRFPGVLVQGDSLMHCANKQTGPARRSGKASRASKSWMIFATSLVLPQSLQGHAAGTRHGAALLRTASSL